jgi:hypothetical protein
MHSDLQYNLFLKNGSVRSHMKMQTSILTLKCNGKHTEKTISLVNGLLTF